MNRKNMKKNGLVLNCNITPMNRKNMEKQLECFLSKHLHFDMFLENMRFNFIEKL